MKKSKNTLYLCEFTLGLMAALLFLNLYLSRKIPASHAIHRLFQMTSVLSIVIIVLILIQREMLSVCLSMLFAILPVYIIKNLWRRKSRI